MGLPCPGLTLSYTRQHVRLSLSLDGPSVTAQMLPEPLLEHYRLSYGNKKHMPALLWWFKEYAGLVKGHLEG